MWQREETVKVNPLSILTCSVSGHNKKPKWKSILAASKGFPLESSSHEVISQLFQVHLSTEKDYSVDQKFKATANLPRSGQGQSVQCSEKWKNPELHLRLYWPQSAG
ncbi:hypothetical protein CHARACLAT_018918 [Characodon lateralis]|uniref:Uncharacterized protein n=1 Tax=Characodon lateralis TaxID=208331 RepID=A0ABU7EAV2_9TELE|nr:hypothetical protein [Characodon lateralis]